MQSKVINQTITDNYAMYHSDCVHGFKGLPDNSLHLGVTSPPFVGMYVYSNSAFDMGNVVSIEQMINQFSFLAKEMLRVLVHGRSVFIHLTQAVAQKQRDGYMGLRDFRGPIIEMMTNVGFNYYGEITIDKDPQLKAMRTKDHGLMFKSLANDAARMHVAMSDFVMQFQKPGDNPLPIKAGKSKKYNNEQGWVTSEQWINWARPVWYAADYQPGTWTEHSTGEPCLDGIRETDVLNVRQARDTNDERHLCPLQLGVIDRIVKVWSAPDEIVFDPFGGIGSTGYVAIKNGRRFVGTELKESYYKSAVQNLNNAIAERGAVSLFDLEPEAA
jgi:DNA modification methylase